MKAQIERKGEKNPPKPSEGFSGKPAACQVWAAGPQLPVSHTAWAPSGQVIELLMGQQDQSRRWEQWGRGLCSEHPSKAGSRPRCQAAVSRVSQCVWDSSCFHSSAIPRSSGLGNPTAPFRITQNRPLPQGGQGLSYGLRQDQSWRAHGSSIHSPHRSAVPHVRVHLKGHVWGDSARGISSGRSVALLGLGAPTLLGIQEGMGSGPRLEEAPC